MLVLLCNVGSTSLKFKLYNMPDENLIVECKIERIGDVNNGILKFSNKKNTIEYNEDNISILNFDAGIRVFLDLLVSDKTGAVGSIEDIKAIGFKAPHAKGITGTQLITEKVIAAMEDYNVVNPQHNPYYVNSMKMFKNILPDTPMIAVFETAFHQTFPTKAQMYGIPAEWRKKYGFRRFGFHGASHGFIASQIMELSNHSNNRLISCHLGGSSSICAINNGISIDNSFGFSSQSGIDHANRPGDLDPYIILYLIMKEGYSAEQISKELITSGGIKGISEISNDVRDIQIAAEKGNEQAKLALEVYCYEVIKYIGAYYAVLGGLDYLVFTGGVGENSYKIREMICDYLKHMKIILDAVKNENSHGNGIQEISSDESEVKVMVIPTNEEIGIAREAYRLLGKNNKN